MTEPTPTKKTPSPLGRWIPASILLALTVIALLSWLHFEQRRGLQESTRLVLELRQSQVELAKGFLQFSLFDETGNTMDRNSGLRLLEQSTRSFERALGQLGTTDTARDDAFRRSVENFRTELTAWQRDQRGLVALRIAFANLERQANQLDQAARQHIEALSADNNRSYALSLTGSLLSLGLILGIILNIAGKEHRSLVEQLRQTKARNESEARFRQLFEDAPVAMALVDHHGKILAQNADFEVLFGYTLRDIPDLESWWLKAFPDPAYRTEVRAYWHAALDNARHADNPGKTIETGESRISCKDGAERTVRITTMLLPEGLLSAFIDLTDIRTAEQAMTEAKDAAQRSQAERRQALEMLAAIADATDDAIFAKDKAGCYLLFNRAASQFVGKPATEVIGHDDHDLFPPTQAETLQAIDRQVMQQEQAITREEELDTADGHRTFLSTKGPLRDRHGVVIGIFGISHNITPQKLAERERQATQQAALEIRQLAQLALLNQMQDTNEARAKAETALALLHESKIRLKLFIEHAPAALAMFDRDMCYLAFSRRWLDDYGLTGRNLKGLRHYEVFPEINDAWKAIHQRALAGEVIRNDEDYFARADGSGQWLRWEVRPWQTADGEIGGIVVFSEDTTQRKVAEMEIQRLNADLEKRVLERTAELSAANRELDSFAYAVSHDLRAPLRAMNGFSHALIEDFGAQLGGDAKTYLDQIIIASRKMSELIDGLLALSRCTRGEMQFNPVDLSAIATQRLQALALTTPERKITWQVAPGLMVNGDTRMLDVVMTNLLDNAWKYTSKTDAAEIRVYEEERAGERCFIVADNGAGFDMAHAERLFKPFQRLHRQDEFPGTGIGLATVQRIIHRHGGDISAHGEPNKGAYFCFTILADASPNKGTK